MTRQTKTPCQRAEEQLGVADRHVGRLANKAANLRAELADVETERDAWIARRDYLAQHPDLPQQPTVRPGTTRNQSGDTAP